MGYLVLVFQEKRARRASVVCASRQRLAVDPLASNCLREQQANQVNQVLQDHLELQVLGLMANRAHQVCLVLQEKRVNKETKETRDWTARTELQDCLENLVVMD